MMTKADTIRKRLHSMKVRYYKLEIEERLQLLEKVKSIDIPVSVQRAIESKNHRIIQWKQETVNITKDDEWDKKQGHPPIRFMKARNAIENKYNEYDAKRLQYYVTVEFNWKDKQYHLKIDDERQPFEVKRIEDELEQLERLLYYDDRNDLFDDFDKQLINFVMFVEEFMDTILRDKSSSYISSDGSIFYFITVNEKNKKQFNADYYERF